MACKYIFKKGPNKGKHCKAQLTTNGNYCHKHAHLNTRKQFIIEKESVESVESNEYNESVDSKEYTTTSDVSVLIDKEVHKINPTSKGKNKAESKVNKLIKKHR